MKVLSLQLHYLWDNSQGFICALLNQTSQEMCVCVCQNDGVVKGLHFQAAACPGRNEADRKGRRAQTAPSHTRTEPHTHTHLLHLTQGGTSWLEVWSSLGALWVAAVPQLQHGSKISGECVTEKPWVITEILYLSATTRCITEEWVVKGKKTLNTGGFKKCNIPGMTILQFHP